MSMYLKANNPFPACNYATFRYVQQVTVSPVSNGIAGIWVFRANGCHDPDVSGSSGGGQPYGWDQYRGLYDNYQVLGSTITVQGLPNTNADFAGFGIELDTDTTHYLQSKQLCAKKGSTYTLGGQNQSNSVLSRSWSKKYDLGANTATLTTQDPSDPFYYRIFTMTETASRDVEFNVTINYRVKFWNLKDLSL